MILFLFIGIRSLRNCPFLTVTKFKEHTRIAHYSGLPELNTKLNKCVENVVRIHSETAEDKLTQIIFCDLEAPDGKQTIPSTTRVDKITMNGTKMNSVTGTMTGGSQLKKFRQ